MNRLFLHIGINKTGTSAIQGFLREQEKALRKSGFLYPDGVARANAHHAIAHLLGGRRGQPPGAADQRDKWRRKLCDEARSARCQTLVISSEDFTICRDLDVVGDFFQDFETTVVVYLRRHDHWWLSAYNQAVRMVANPPWERGVQAYIAYSNERRPAVGNYRLLVDAWAARFGVASIQVRPYESAQNPGGVVADFLRTIGMEELALVAAQRSQRVNVSLTRDDVALMDMVQRAEISPVMRERVIKLLLAQSSDGSQPGLMRPKLRRRLIDQNRDDYGYIATQYLGRTDGVLFREPEPTGNEPWETRPPLTQVDVATKLLNLLDR